MWCHWQIGETLEQRNKIVLILIRKGAIKWGGNKRLKIYGRLDCASGKLMKIENRVFFSSESEAVLNGYRPCGNCMRENYKEWKDRNEVK